MAPNDHVTSAEPDKTQPPLAALRYATPSELYAKMPHVSQLTLHRPDVAERAIEYLYRLRASTTPEEAVTYTAFATMPKMGVWWGYECLRLSGDDLSAADRQMMELVANWTQYPDNENRYRAMKAALYAPVLTPATYLGLAVGWSGGSIAPNDPAGVPAHRGPRALNTAVLSCLAQSDLQSRPIRLARFIDQASVLYHAN
ncbi:DUF6931 family protein [Sulfitobacter geojensis]|uniref:Uncharacterized protein n=1 Tax=Sulfitobacter geojensis TaxID=1342299 RepID=A0AAE2W1X3_9RHOB|nr:hypothetical protein [Sulfitobacter geojensis]KHA53941.1 hypothetical protein Z947_288 [Sulfitobacter geojensis]MBM1691276.1 hypothetical protein [Sulfitobacter geojensis]MBM1695401.1 hypothetical protein [Sulfitobacter geojensis]MBM1707501.1 hypothetical protein [Sulfitobacter geojensis]MBM1711592.1 hypothetical protein [Sulfitobacter geojensis]